MKRFIMVVLGTVAFISLIVLPTILASEEYSGKSVGPVVGVEISQGESGSAIADQLVSQGVIKASRPFISLFLSHPKYQSISPGIHLIESRIPSSVAAEQLLDPARIQGLIKVREGSTFQDVLSQLKRSSQIVFTSKLQISASPTFANPSHSWEGQLATANFSFPAHTSANDAIAEMSRAFAREIPPLHLERGVKGFSAYQNLTIASLVQIEGDTKDYAQVARVILNRLKLGMPLQLNSTVQYANGTRGSITLSRKATQVNSAYNTYLHQGLPPTPISFPSVAAIKATLAPAQGDWLYFITVKPGDTRFTAHFAEFEGWVSLFNSNVAKGLFK